MSTIMLSSLIEKLVQVGMDAGDMPVVLSFGEGAQWSSIEQIDYSYDNGVTYLEIWGDAIDAPTTERKR